MVGKGEFLEIDAQYVNVVEEPRNDTLIDVTLHESEANGQGITILPRQIHITLVFVCNYTLQAFSDFRIDSHMPDIFESLKAGERPRSMFIFPFVIEREDID